MKKILLSSVAFLGLATGAMAADLPSRVAPAPAPFAAVPVFTWTGFYVGVNAGYGWNNNDNNSALIVGGVPVDISNGGDDGGFVGGGQIGYNYQIGSFVVGLEADLQWADIGGSNEDVFVPGVGFVNVGNRNTDWFGTVRARAGFAFDRVLVYATGGFAFADDNNSNNCLVGPFVVTCGNGGDSTGWTVGGGVEFALPTNWFASSAVTFGVEGLYVNLGSNDRADIVVAPGLVLAGNSGDNEFGLVRAKLNFKF
jgi:outer membrane immunogenic protein